MKLSKILLVACATTLATFTTPAHAEWSTDSSNGAFNDVHLGWGQ